MVRGGGLNGGAPPVATPSVLSLGFSVSSVNDAATPSGQGLSLTSSQPKKSNWEVIEHYHKSGLHGTSSTAREKHQQQQQQVAPLQYSNYIHDQRYKNRYYPINELVFLL